MTFRRLWVIECEAPDHMTTVEDGAALARIEVDWLVSKRDVGLMLQDRGWRNQHKVGILCPDCAEASHG